MKVAVYTIALNEEKHVERWYNSAKEADYLLILDTGSTDKTVRMAKKLGINVYQTCVKPFRFDIPRNAALALLPEDIDYCISLDMDEVLCENWRAALKVAYDNDISRPRYLYTWSWKDEARTVPDVQFGGDHIHKRHHYRWKNPIHETLVPYEYEETTGWIELKVNHFADKSKPRNYLPLLEMSVHEDPTDDRNAFYYARELYFKKQLDEAKNEFVRHLALPKATWKPERAASMRYIAKCSSKESDKEFWLKAACDEEQSRREPLVDLACLYYKQKKWKECLQRVELAVNIKERPLEYLCESNAWGVLPHILGLWSASHLGDVELALRYCENVLAISPGNEVALENKAILAGLLERASKEGEASELEAS